MKKYSERGITIIVLIISIIILLILATVTIQATNGSGLFYHARRAAFVHDMKSYQEQTKLLLQDMQVQATQDNTEMKEIYAGLSDQEPTENYIKDIANKYKKTDSQPEQVLIQTVDGKTEMYYFNDASIKDNTEHVKWCKETNIPIWPIGSENQSIKITQIENSLGGKKITIDGNKVTVIENGKKYETTVDTSIDPSINDYDENTKNVLSKVYGTDVAYVSDNSNNKEIDNRNWRIFYIDFANKYKDGAGTVYLKADWKSNDNDLSEYSTNQIKDKSKLYNMNSKWSEHRKDIENWNENEQKVAWLCNFDNWTQYKNDKAIYAIASPSIEMYCDSYDSVNHTNSTNYKIGANYRDTEFPGYIYTGTQTAASSGDYFAGAYVLDYENYGSMYCGYKGYSGSYYWWLASPSASGNKSVCLIIGNPQSIATSDDGYSYGLCPIVALPAGTTIEKSETPVSFGMPYWSNGKASVSINTSTNYTIEYQVNSIEGTWTSGTYVTGLSNKDIVYARLTDGTNASDYTSITIEDKIAPTVTLTYETTLSSITVIAKATDNETGMPSNPIYNFNIKEKAESLYPNSPAQSGTETSFTATNLKEGTNYEINVETADIAGNIGRKKINATTKKIGVLQIGDYVNYTPPQDQSFKVGTELSDRKKGEQIFDSTNSGINVWRIWKINSDSIEIVSSEATNTPLYLGGPTGYSQGPEVLNNICSTLYSCPIKNIVARSLDQLDLEEAMAEYWGCERQTTEFLNKLKEYNFTYGQIGQFVSLNNIPNCYTSSDIVDIQKQDLRPEPCSASGYTQRKKLKCSESFYNVYQVSDAIGLARHKILGERNSWLASRCISYGPPYGTYMLCTYWDSYGGQISSTCLFIGDNPNNSWTHSHGITPICTLNDLRQLSYTSTNMTTGFNTWQIN